MCAGTVCSDEPPIECYTMIVKEEVIQDIAESGLKSGAITIKRASTTDDGFEDINGVSAYLIKEISKNRSMWFWDHGILQISRYVK